MFGAFAPPCNRREARRLNRREAILDVAESSFLECGYAGTSMSAIAATLGGSKATLWSYFPSKELLFAAVIDRASQTFREQLSLILNPHDDIGVALRRFARQFLEKVTMPESVALHRLVIGEVSRFPETGRILHDRAVGRTYALLADYLGKAAARGLLCIDQPLAAAQHLMGLCLFGYHHQMLLGVIDAVEPEMIEREVEQSVAAFLRAYGLGTGG